MTRGHGTVARVAPVAPAEALTATGTAARAPRRPGEEERSLRTAELFRAVADTADVGERRRLEDEVATVNMGVARAIATRYRDRGMRTEDLVQVAYLGLVKAVRGFDPDYGRDFLSYAVPTITGEVKRYFRDHGWTVRPPRRIQELQAEVARVSHELSQALGHSPTAVEVADELGVDADQVIEALGADGCFTPSSLDVPVGEDGAATLGDLLDDGEGDREQAAVDARVALAPVVRRLAERDRRILQLRFFSGWTQQQIASDIGVTQMQVSRLLSRILADLRRQLASTPAGGDASTPANSD